MARQSLALLPIALAVVLAGWTLTASNTVPEHDAGVHQQAQNADDLKPPQCAAITLTAVLQAPDLTGTNANELIVGGGTDDSISGGGGDDCLMGGGGDDSLDGGSGGNVLIGGDGTDTCLSGTPHGCEL